MGMFSWFSGNNGHSDASHSQSGPASTMPVSDGAGGSIIDCLSADAYLERVNKAADDNEIKQKSEIDLLSVKVECMVDKAKRTPTIVNGLNSILSYWADLIVPNIPLHFSENEPSILDALTAPCMKSTGSEISKACEQLGSVYVNDSGMVKYEIETAICAAILASGGYSCITRKYDEISGWEYNAPSCHSYHSLVPDVDKFVWSCGPYNTFYPFKFFYCYLPQENHRLCEKLANVNEMNGHRFR